jgi:hypothetical protein
LALNAAASGTGSQKGSQKEAKGSIVGEYRYDLDELHDTASGLRRLQSDFENASTVRQAAAGAFGWSWLEGAVDSFVENWEHNRSKQIETIQKTHEALTEITANYVALDTEGVAQLNEA